MEKLKPCPFCGYEHPVFGGSGGFVSIRCPQCQTAFECDCTCGRNKDKQATIGAWNRRPASRQLTLQEVRERAGGVVWVQDLLLPTCSDWHFVEAEGGEVWLFDRHAVADGFTGYNATTTGHGYMETWVAYDRRPEV